MQCVTPLSRRLWLHGILLGALACSDPSPSANKCAGDDDTDCNTSSSESGDDSTPDEGGDDDEDASASDAGKMDAGGRRDAGRAAMDAGSPRDSGVHDGGSAGGDADIPSASDGRVAIADSGGGTAAPNQKLPPITDYLQPGPFKTTTEPNTGPGNNYTIYRPDPLGANGFVHSPIVFGPGILTTADFYSNLLIHLASHGFVTICVNSLNGGPGDPANLQAMQMGLDWLIAQNDEAGVFQGKLAVDRAIAMGYSIGAGASVELSSHPAVMTTVVIHDHNTSGDPHGPVLRMTGTMDVIDDMRMTLSTLDEAPAIMVALPIGHLDVLVELAMLADISPTTRYIAPITGWLRYWVNGDDDAKRFFWGADCEMCKSLWSAPETNAKWDAQML